ncbi:MAG: hypothetical protein D6730_05435 [Bacteroidetes bacterium]|nr:MAG: hypothetical protein D6730_05435 [Bacteroidota bacterium]
MDNELLTVAHFPYEHDARLRHILVRLEEMSIPCFLMHIHSSNLKLFMGDEMSVSLQVPASQLARALKIVHQVLSPSPEKSPPPLPHPHYTPPENLAWMQARKLLQKQKVVQSRQLLTWAIALLGGLALCLILMNGW